MEEKNSLTENNQLSIPGVTFLNCFRRKKRLFLAIFLLLVTVISVSLLYFLSQTKTVPATIQDKNQITNSDVNSEIKKVSQEIKDDSDTTVKVNFDETFDYFKFNFDESCDYDMSLIDNRSKSVGKILSYHDKNRNCPSFNVISKDFKTYGQNFWDLVSFNDNNTPHFITNREEYEQVVKLDNYIYQIAGYTDYECSPSISSQLVYSMPTDHRYKYIVFHLGSSQFSDDDFVDICEPKEEIINEKVYNIINKENLEVEKNLNMALTILGKHKLEAEIEEKIDLKLDLGDIRKYDEDIERLMTGEIEDNLHGYYLKNLLYECDEKMYNNLYKKFTNIFRHRRGGFELNGHNYKFSNCNYESNCTEITTNLDDWLKTINYKQNYNTLDSPIGACLYKGNDRVFKYSIYSYIVTGYFGGNADIGEGASEWFRFKSDDDLYIFLRGGMGCGGSGCYKQGPYFKINTTTNKIIVGLQEKIPHQIFTYFLPGKRYGIEWKNYYFGTSTDDLYIYDFVMEKRVGPIFEMPENKTIYFPHMIDHLLDGALEIENNKLKIQLFDKDNDKNIAICDGWDYSNCKKSDELIVVDLSEYILN